ncbi:DUF397 domain-containing protein [Streptomyces sp. RKND-216]|uniref:DUF397 domain-containing protein n=1 Tax=Streptomyces sp. RKND-216 TaxID=2562581 RepID=UPI00109DA645|nr:DUF397 domain-containing protein [Streptomyces sp. RKND-216]THA25074.1 DUF397 domain-containing protein [Streptomyces sp. RKND-216]
MTRRLVSDDAALSWFKSSYSASDSNDCVEVAAAQEAVRVRDSKRRGGPQLAVGEAAWRGFVAYVTGEGARP